MTDEIRPNDLTAHVVQRWLEEVAAPGELVRFAESAYWQMMIRIAEAKASPDEWSGLWHSFRDGWRVRFFHLLAEGQVTCELARDGEVRPVFEYQAPATRNRQ